MPLHVVTMSACSQSVGLSLLIYRFVSGNSSADHTCYHWQRAQRRNDELHQLSRSNCWIRDNASTYTQDSFHAWLKQLPPIHTCASWMARNGWEEHPCSKGNDKSSQRGERKKADLIVSLSSASHSLLSYPQTYTWLVLQDPGPGSIYLELQYQHDHGPIANTQ